MELVLETERTTEQNRGGLVIEFYKYCKHLSLLPVPYRTIRSMIALHFT